MSVKFVHLAVLGTLILGQFTASIAAETADQNETSEDFNDLRDFAGTLTQTFQKETQQYMFPDVNQLSSHKFLPDPFAMPDGSRVRTKDDWEKQRGYLKAMLTHYQYGRMPPKPGNVAVESRATETIYGGEAIWTTFDIVISRRGEECRVRAGLLRPNKAGQFPVIIKNDEFLFHTSEIQSLSLRRLYEERKCGQIDEFVRREATKRRYVIFKFIRTDLAPDEEDNRNKGVFILYPEYDWGTIAAWAWGYQIAIDILEREPHVDRKNIVATGHARGGKSALCAGIYDERIAITAPHASGEGGTGGWRFFDPEQRPEGLLRYKVFGGEYFWVPRLFTFIGREDKMPFDAHFAKGLIAPRVLLNTYAREDYTANPYGAYVTHLAAQRVFILLEVKENCLIHWRDGNDHKQNEEDWMALFDVCDKMFFGKEIYRKFNDNPFPNLHQSDRIVDLNSGGMTALHWAASIGRRDLVELLIARGVNLDARDNDGCTSLHRAAEEGHRDIVNLLLNKGAEATVKDKWGRLPLDIAKRRGHAEIVKLLTICSPRPTDQR